MLRSKVVVYVESTGAKEKFENVEVSTVADIKALLRAKGIEFNDSDVTIKEAISRAEYPTDESILPVNMPYDGGITNDLICKLVAKRDKIKSGSDIPSRSDLYQAIRDYDLSEKVYDLFGAHYTNVSSVDLYDLIINEVGDVFDTPSDEGAGESEERESEPEMSFRESALRIYLSGFYLSESAIDQIVGYVNEFYVENDNRSNVEEMNKIFDF